MTQIPAGAKKPTDHQAQKNESDPENAEPIIFEWDEITYEIDPTWADDVEIVEAFEDDRFVSVVRSVLGKAQWDAWKERNRGDNGRVKATAAEPFLKALMEAARAGN